MLDWLLKMHADTAAELKATQQKALRLEGGLVAWEAAIRQARATGGGSVAAPTAPIPSTTSPGAILTAPEKQWLQNAGTPTIQGVTSAVKVPHGPIQADEELRD